MPLVHILSSCITCPLTFPSQKYQPLISGQCWCCDLSGFPRITYPDLWEWVMRHSEFHHIRPKLLVSPHWFPKLPLQRIDVWTRAKIWLLPRVLIGYTYLMLAPLTHHILCSNLEAGHRASQTGAGPSTVTSMTFAPCEGHARLLCVLIGLHAWMISGTVSLNWVFSHGHSRAPPGSDKIRLLRRRGTGLLADHHQPHIHI